MFVYSVFLLLILFSDGLATKEMLNLKSVLQNKRSPTEIVLSKEDVTNLAAIQETINTLMKNKIKDKIIIAGMENEINKFSHEVTQEIRDLKNTLQAQKKRIDDLRKGRDQDRKVVQNLMEENKAIKERLLNTFYRTLEKDKGVSKGKAVLNLKSQSIKRQLGEGYGAAFTACVGVDDLLDVVEHQKVIFERVISNVGEYYNSETGVFTAPESGVYVFHVSLATKAGKRMYLDIVKDGEVVDDMLTDGRLDGSWESSSDMWVLKLNSGSEVWMQTTYDGGEIHGKCHTLFSGFLLYYTEE